MLDAMLPGLTTSGLTAKTDVSSRVKGLQIGAEDYIIKPFEMLELLVRIEKILDRTGEA